MFSSYAMPWRGRSKNYVWQWCSHHTVFPVSMCRTAKVGAFPSKYTIKDDKYIEDEDNSNHVEMDYMECEMSKQHIKANPKLGTNKNVTLAVCDNLEQY